MPYLFLLTLSLLPWIPAFLCRVTTLEEFTLLEGRSVTVPCHYEPQYSSYVKYWCQGRTREFCTSLARTDDPRLINPDEDKVSIFDDPVQQVFTVTMNDLKEGDSGWYMCGVEIGGVWNADDAAFTNIRVVHGMSVVNSRVSSEEGGTVTVECLYSERYRESEKKWCRSGDWRTCLLTASGERYEDASVAISDDRTGAFTVTLKNLEMRDTGWYWCSAGQQKMSVHVLVTPRPTTTVSITSSSTPSPSVAHLPPPKPITKESGNSHNHMLESMVVCLSLFLLVALALLARKLWKMQKRDPLLRQAKEMNVRFNEYSGDPCDLQNATVVFLNKESQDAHIY
ncbi:polymeric immunoglobulin receptor isoform X2 [Parambassis ranga]|uniref:polymeric immunoglobulin receptor isoform X2 n=1 Tax=Parambassis ranga TaxID=210632 RepID=UPI0010426CED|nr:polymeric immunoglobulin receptor-like isoform X2 [Parambassis ranga]